MATPDSGSTRSVITKGTADLVIATNPTSKPGIKLISVPAYQIDLADEKFINCNQQAITDMTLVTPGAKATLHNVTMNVLPGPPSPLLIGRVELARLQLPGMWELIQRAILKPGYMSGKPLNETAFKASDPLQD